ncbi:ras-related protein Rab-22A-like [Lineus longissimus]|uniref:ras-related protein Rab-22A-like n=1 Tax=Lineus longissimus TaxID=88925 RepID=UPI002B4F4295
MAIREVKICLVGKMGVGKTCIAERFVSETFKVTETTIGALFMTKTFILDGTVYKFQIWDTAGQEKYRALAPMYYRGAAAAIVVYDITEEDSFNCLKGWIKELQRYGPPNLLVALCGNKCDLGDLREVTFEDAKAFSESCHSIFLETSAKTGQNVNELFIEISRSLPAEIQDKNSSLVRLPSRRTAERQKSSKGCCKS